MAGREKPIILRPVAMPEPIPDKSTEHLPSYLPRSDFVALLLGPPRSGKSHTINNLILRSELYRNVFDTIHLISPTAQNDDSMAHLLKCDCVTYHADYSDQLINAIVSDQEAAKKDAEKHGDRPPRCLIVVDDGVGLMDRRSALAQLSTRYRHYATSILIASQVFREISNTIRKNASWLIIYPMSSMKELAALSEEYESAAPGVGRYVAALNRDRREFLYIIPGHSMRIGFTPETVWKS